MIAFPFVPGEISMKITGVSYLNIFITKIYLNQVLMEGSHGNNIFLLHAFCINSQKKRTSHYIFVAI